MNPDDPDELEEHFRLISDEEAEQLALANQNRLRRARLNVGKLVLEGKSLGDVSYEVVAKVAVEILEGKIPIRTAAQARDVAAVFHQIARLEANKSTQNIETLTRADREARLAELAEAAAERAEGLRLISGDG